jgi:hypothetical protein
MTGAVRRDHLRRRLRTLAVLELANLGWLPAVVFGALAAPATIANVSGTVVALVVLAQGSAYWWLKLKQLRDGSPRPQGLRAYTVFRPLNWCLLGASLVGVVMGLLTSSGLGVWPGVVFWLLAVAEQINYFCVQLMHDTSADLRRLRLHWLRRSHLASDLLLGIGDKRTVSGARN